MDIEPCERCGRPLTPERVRNDIRICRACEHPDSMLVTISEHVRRDILERRTLAGSDTTAPPPLLPSRVTQPIKMEVRNAVQPPPSPRLPPPDLRSRLIKVRESSMALLYSGVPRERGLLRRKMLDELVQHRPTTRSEFFRYIQPDLLANTDPVQFAVGLEYVLAIIREFQGKE